MQALILSALVAAAAASGIGSALTGGYAGASGIALIGAPKVALAAAPVRAIGYGAARKSYADDYAEPRPYQYQYAVDDPAYGPMFEKQEQADGAGTVQGYYTVNLPDGRTQQVKYVADGYNGFNAEVTYEGYANHPQVARGYGYGATQAVAVQPVAKAVAVQPVVATGGLGLLGRRTIGGYRAGSTGLARIGSASLLGRRAALKPALTAIKPVAPLVTAIKPVVPVATAINSLAYGH